MKRTTRFLALALMILAVSACGILRPNAAQRKLLPAQPSGVPEQILAKKSFTVSYNKATRLPNWVFWQLTSEHVNGDAVRPGNAYHEENKVAKPRATPSDYRKTGYTRGHMCPAGDNKWDRNAMYDSFSLANICPQTERCNSGVWNAIEMQCREWALEYGDVYIVSGPIVPENPDTIGENKIAVPEAFFKVVVSLKGKKRGIGFICDNTDRNQTMKNAW